MKVTIDLGRPTGAPHYVDVEIPEYRCRGCRDEFEAAHVERLPKDKDGIPRCGCGGEVHECDEADEIASALAEGRGE